MKKRKILYLFPLTALLLSGCSIQEGWNAVKNWVGEKIYFPVANWISGEDSEKDEKKEDQGIKRIAIETWPTEVAQGSTVLTSSVTVHVYYSDGTEAIKEAEEVVCDTSTPGETELIAKFGGKEAKKIVTVISAAEVVHVESIRYTVKQGINVGEQVQIEVTFTPDNATDKSLTFQSEKEDILTVSATGLVTGVAPGQAKVRVTPLDNPGAAKDISFTVNPPSQGLPGKTTKNYEKLAANETLLNGEKVSIVGTVGEDYYAMQNYTSGNNIKGRKTDLTEDGLAVNDADEFTVIDAGEGKVAFMQADGKYLAATGGSTDNKLQVADTIGETSLFTYLVDENGVAHITAPAVTRGSLRLNPNLRDGVYTPLFACYAETSSVSGNDYAIYHDGNGSSEVVHVESVSFGENEYTVEIGQTLAINAAVSPATATNKNISYELLDVEPEGAVSIDGNTLTGALVGTATLKATSEDNQAATATTSIKIVEAINPEHAGTLEDPYSVADTKIVIDKGLEMTDKYAKGIVSKIVTPYNSQYGNISFNMSDDGSTEGFQLQGYRTKGTEQFPIASDEDIQVGDVVTLHGNLKLYGSTYEFDAGNELVGREREVIKVESIALDPTQASMTVGLADLTIAATVLPENAADKSLDWSSSNEAVATVENGVVHAVAEGDVVITATAKDESGVSASASIHVELPAKEVETVVVSAMPAVEYTEGDFIDLTGMELTITYNDQSVDEHVTEGYVASIAADHALTLEDTQLVISYGGVEAEPIALTINALPRPTHAGTLEDPYTVDDAHIQIDNWPNDLAGKHVAGKVSKIVTPYNDGYKNISFNISADGTEEGTQFQGYRTKGTEAFPINSANSIKVGDSVILKGNLKKYNSTYELDAGNELVGWSREQQETTIKFFYDGEEKVVSPESHWIGGGWSTSQYFAEEFDIEKLTAQVSPEGATYTTSWTKDEVPCEAPTNPIPAGTYCFKVDVEATVDYKAASEYILFNIKEPKLDPSIKFFYNGEEKCISGSRWLNEGYGDSQFPANEFDVSLLTYAVSPELEATVTWTLDEQPIAAPTGELAPGTYAMTVSVAGNEEYNSATVWALFAITGSEKVNPVISFSYDGSPVATDGHWFNGTYADSQFPANEFDVSKLAYAVSPEIEGTVSWTLDEAPCAAPTGELAVGTWCMRVDVAEGNNNNAAANWVLFAITEATLPPEPLAQTAAYTGSTTNMDGSNQAALLGVTDSHLSLVGTKENGGTNNVGLNKSGQIRLYRNETCALTISIDGGTITSLDIKLGGTVDGLALNGTSVAGIAANTTVSVDVNGTTAVLTNNGTSAQTYILEITIHYVLNA